MDLDEDEEILAGDQIEEAENSLETLLRYGKQLLYKNRDEIAGVSRNDEARSI
jgi:hypothetical protein